MEGNEQGPKQPLTPEEIAAAEDREERLEIEQEDLRAEKESDHDESGEGSDEPVSYNSDDRMGENGKVVE